MTAALGREMAEVVGREHELAQIDAVLSDARDHFAGVVLAGDPGIGKTTLWREAVRRAEAAGFRVLSCRPAEAEAKLAFASLADLLSPIGDDVLSALPEPQRLALDVALLRTRPRATASLPRAVAAGLLSVVSRLSEISPVLVAIDDAQWLDPASASALAFALRRVDPHAPVALVVSLRLEPGRTDDVLDLGRLKSIERISVEPLGLSALYHVIHNEFGLVFPRPTLQRIEKASGGNPLFAIELARALEESGGRPGPGESLPVPDELAGLLRARVARLPARSRECLLAASLLTAPSTQLLERALGPAVEEGLERAVAADVIDVRGKRVTFRHPLLATAVWSTALPSRRRAMHRRLAAAIENEEERARHLAFATEGRDESVAASLDEAAHMAEQRGACDNAVELLELGVGLTPDDDSVSLARRRLELARVLLRAGDAPEARRLLDELLAADTAGPPRARALELRAHIHWVDGGTAAGSEVCCHEALQHVGDDSELRARVLVTLARVTMDSELCRRRARAALDLLETLDNPAPALLSEALEALAGAEFRLTGRIPIAIVERGLALERLSPPVDVSDRMSAALGSWLKWAADFEGARYWFEQTYRAAVNEGDEGSLPYALSHLPQIELWSGNWERAEERAREHLELAIRTGQSTQRLMATSSLSLVLAHMGRVAEARVAVEEAIAEAELGYPWNAYQLCSALGFIELSVGRYEEAAAALGRAVQIYEDFGQRGWTAVYEDYVEALVVLGDLETAARAVESFERWPQESTRASALRSRALWHAARQELDGAAAALDEALEHHERVQMPFSRARTLLVLGQVRRRRGERRAACAALEEALAIFEELGAPLWAQRASDELARIPIRRRSTTDELTPAEARVADLVARGLTNREIARSLFLSVKTVESNLTRVYRKLGVRSRSELAARLAASKTGNGAAIP